MKTLSLGAVGLLVLTSCVLGSPHVAQAYCDDYGCDDVTTYVYENESEYAPVQSYCEYTDYSSDCVHYVSDVSNSYSSYSESSFNVSLTLPTSSNTTRTYYQPVQTSVYYYYPVYYTQPVFVPTPVTTPVVTPVKKSTPKTTVSKQANFHVVHH